MTNTDYIYLQSVSRLDVNAKADAFEEGNFAAGPEEEKKVNIIIDSCTETGTGILTPEDPGYPEMLKSIYAFPYALYTRGSAPKGGFIAVSGTRTPGIRGRGSAEQIGETIAALGASVLTLRHGGADSAAASAALKKGGHVCTVLNAGFKNSRNRMLRRFPDRYGEVSEYYPEMDCSGVNQRHAFRIAAGMCQVLVMIDMPETGNLRCFAEEALEQGKEVLLLQNGKETVSGTYARRLVSEGAIWFGNVRHLIDKLTESSITLHI